MARKVLSAIAVGVAAFSALMSNAGAVPAGLKEAREAEAVGLWPAQSFQLDEGKCKQCITASRPELLYFENDYIAVPLASMKMPPLGYTAGADRRSDVAKWAAKRKPGELDQPSAIWIGAPSILEHARVLPGMDKVRTGDGAEIAIKLVPKLATNRSYANAATAAWFANRDVRMRGKLETMKGVETFVARTIWPEDFAFDPAKWPAKPLKQASDLAAFVRAPVKAGGSLDTRVLWERHPGQPRDWKQKPVLGFVLNGAQGDDDESLGGHFAVATGRIGSKGEWGDWAVNNFYNLDSYSEKGIIAATLPMDNYLMDLNSGQQYYRPSYMLVAVLNDARTAEAFQGGVQRVFNHFYRHDFQYRHASANCAGISVDVFDSLGWNIPERGPTAPLKSLAAYAYVAAKDGSLQSGRKIYDYLNEEQTRLLPAIAFEETGLDLLRIVEGSGKERALSTYEQQLKSDIEAIFLVRIPQVPSSRVDGSAPVFSFDEFRSRVPEDQADWQIVPVEPRPFPDALRDPLSVREADPAPVPAPIAGIGAVGVFGVLGALILWRRKRQRKSAVKSSVPAPEETVH